MAFSSEIKARLGLDVSGLTEGLNKSKSQLALWGNDAERIVGKAFGFKDVARGLLQGIGLASAEQAAQKLVQPFKESAESAQRIAEWTQKGADATERQIALRRTDLEQLAAMEKELARLTSASKAPAEIGFFRGLAGSLAAQFGLTELSAKLFKNPQANAEKAAESAAAINVQALAVAQKKAEIEEKAFLREQKNIETRAGWVRANREQVELEAKAISGRILPDERARLDVLQQQQKIRENEEKIEAILVKYPEQRTQADKDNLTVALRQREVLENQLTIKQDILAATKKQAEAEATIGQAIDSNLEKWKGFQLAITTSGRSNKDLEDKELQRKISQLQGDISMRENAQFMGLGFDAGAAAAGGQSDVLLGVQRNNLRQALAELQFRQSVRSQASTFGEDFAFNNNPGLSLDRLRSILQGTPEETRVAQRTANAVEKLTRLFESGQARAVTVSGDSKGR